MRKIVPHVVKHFQMELKFWSVTSYTSEIMITVQRHSLRKMQPNMPPAKYQAFIPGLVREVQF